MENNITEIDAQLKAMLNPLIEGMPKLMDKLTNELNAQMNNNPDLAKEYHAVLKDANLSDIIAKAEKDIKNINHIFRK